MTHYPVFCHRISHYLFLLPIHYLLPTKWQCRPGGQLGNSYKSSSASPSTFATYFVYIVHLISIDLQLSRSLNSPTLQSLYLGLSFVATFSLSLTYFSATSQAYRLIRSYAAS